MGSEGSIGGTPTSSVECCMCGDHGLSSELFRCRSCQSRHQHKYCSDLYPKAEQYRSCNWCLREEAKSSSTSIPFPPTNEANNSNTISNGSNGHSSALRAKLQRGEFKNVNKPVKKRRPVLERSASDVTVRLKAEEMISSSPPRGKQGAMRGKMRRYKLLEEVSS